LTRPICPYFHATKMLLWLYNPLWHLRWYSSFSCQSTPST